MKTYVVLGIAVASIHTMTALAGDDTRRALADELLNVMEMRVTVEKSLEAAKATLPMQVGKAVAMTEETNAPSCVAPLAQMMDVWSKEMSWEKVKADYIDLYAKTFTEEELKGIIDFCKTPAGQAFAKKQPELAKGTMELKQKRVASVMLKLQELRKQFEAKDKPGANK